MHDDILVNTLGPEEVSRPKDATHTEDATTDNERYFNCACLLIYLPSNIQHGFAIFLGRTFMLL